MDNTIDHGIIIAWVACFSIVTVFGTVIFISDLLLCLLKSKDSHLRTNNRWQSTIAIFFDILQMGLFIAGGVLNGKASYPRKPPYEWLDLANLCVLQLFTSTNLARLFYVLRNTLWMTWVTYGAVIAVTTLEVLIHVRWHHVEWYLYGPVLLVLSIISATCAITIYKILRQHIHAGGVIPSMAILMKAFFGTKLLAVLCEIVGGTTLIACLVQNQEEPEMHIRQIFIIVCLFAEGGFSLSFFSKALRHHSYKKVKDSARKTFIRQPASNDDEAGDPYGIPTRI